MAFFLFYERNGSSCYHFILHFKEKISFFFFLEDDTFIQYKNPVNGHWKFIKKLKGNNVQLKNYKIDIGARHCTQFILDQH